MAIQVTRIEIDVQIVYNEFNRTRQGYVLRNILKLAGRFFYGDSR